MALPQDELKRRIDAARTLRGMTQRELGDRLAEDGFGKHDLGRVERGDPRMPFNNAILRALCHHLEVPERWFTDRHLTFHDHPPAEVDQHLLTEIHALVSQGVDVLLSHDRYTREAASALRELREGYYTGLEHKLNVIYGWVQGLGGEGFEGEVRGAPRREGTDAGSSEVDGGAPDDRG